jgi:PPOX class probable F420-dependent enzyme
VKLSPDECRRRLTAADVARLATVDTHGRPHLVPITFAVDDDRLVTAVDHKPKSTTDLKRLRNIAANPAVTVLADHYSDDWTTLWWVRADGSAQVIAEGKEYDAALALLTAKYPQYADSTPAGPIIVVQVESWTGWSA